MRNALIFLVLVLSLLFPIVAEADSLQASDGVTVITMFTVREHNPILNSEVITWQPLTRR